jgi:hypothetical protein
MEAQGSPIQRSRRWPADRTRGIITVTGRTFHSSVECPGYRRGVRDAAHPAAVERVSANTARRRGKGVCARCWR